MTEPRPLDGLLNRPAVRSILLFLDFFLIILAYYQVKPASRSLFLEHGNAAQLPYLWVGSAGLLLVMMPVYQRMVRHFSRLNIVLGTCAVVVALLVLFRVLLREPDLPTAVGFYLLVDIFSVVLVEQFWSLTNSVYRSSDGRRWYGFIASGGLVGGLVGGLLAAGLVSARIVTTADLLLVSAGIIALMMLLTWWLAHYGFYDEALPLYKAEKSDAADIWTAMRNSRYLALIALMLLLSQISEPIVEYQFMRIVEQTYTDKDARTAYLSGFLSLLSGIALFVNLAVAPLLLKRFGAAAGILAQPVLLGISSLWLAFDYRLMVAGAVKLADRALSYSINRTARELLYVWVDAATIYRAKAWIDMVGYRGFKILGSLAILLLTQWLPWKVGDAGLSWTVVVICAIWIVAGLYLARRLLPELIVRAQRASAPAEPAPVAPVGVRRTVLIAEDHPQSAKMLRMVLEDWGFAVIHAEDGLIVKERVATQAPPDLAMLDINMPHIDGLELVALIRAQPEWREVPIIMLTGRTGEREINRALDSGANDYMVKPFRIAELQARIGRLLGGVAPSSAAPAATS